MRRKVSNASGKENRIENAAFGNSGMHRDPVGVLPIENDPLGAMTKVRLNPAKCKAGDVKRLPKLVQK